MNNKKQEVYEYLRIMSNVNGYTIHIGDDNSTFRVGETYVVRSKKELNEKITELMVDVEE